MLKIRIGTRDSELALWQAHLVKDKLQQQGIESTLVPVKSEGDIDTVTPLYAMGVQGVFTRSLDVALLKGDIDIAVHSMKDVPVQLPQGLVQAAVLERGPHKDIFVVNDTNALPTGENIDKYLTDHEVTIATSSIRRKAQWLSRYPHHQVENLRGNVNTRLRKVKESAWAGAVFAAAGLERIGLRPVNSFDLDWMLPAPAQGAIMVAANESNVEVIEACGKLNHLPTSIAVTIERDFLSALMGGCSSPIGAFCHATEKGMTLQGNLASTDGSKTITVHMDAAPGNYHELGQWAADEIKRKGGAALLTKK